MKHFLRSFIYSLILKVHMTEQTEREVQRKNYVNIGLFISFMDADRGM